MNTAVLEGYERRYNGQAASEDRFDDHTLLMRMAGSVHEQYLKQYRQWLSKSPDRPQEIALYELIWNINYTSSMELWGTPSKPNLPKWETLEAKLTTDGYYGTFSNTYNTLTAGLEKWTDTVVMDIRRAEVRAGFETSSDPEDDVRAMDSALAGFQETEWGREALATLGRDVDEAYHPLNLFGAETLSSYLDGNKRFDFARQQSKGVLSVAQKSVGLFAKFVPAFLVMVRPDQQQLKNLRIIGRSVVEFASRFVSVPAAMAARYTGTSQDLDGLVKTFERDATDIASELRQWGNARRSGLTTLKRFGAVGGAVTALGNLVEFVGAAGRAVVDPTAKTIEAATASAIKAIGDVDTLRQSLQTAFGKLDDATDTADTAAKAVNKAARKLTFGLLVEIAGPIGDAYDAFTNGVASYERYQVGDRSAAFGNALQVVGAGIGVAWGLAALSAKITGVGAGLMASGVGLWVGLAAVAVGLIGFALVELTSENWFELFFENCRFGTEWPREQSFYERPDTDFFKWRTTVAAAEATAKLVPERTTRLNAARQASTMMSRTTGFQVSLSDALGPPPVPPRHYYDGTTEVPWNDSLVATDLWPFIERTLSFDAPEAFSDDSYVLIKRVEKRGDVYDVVPLWYVQFGQGTEIYGFKKPAGDGRFDTPRVLVHHEKKPDARKWTMRIAEPVTQPNGLLNRQEAVVKMFRKSGPPAYLEIDVIPGDIGGSPSSDAVERDLRKRDEAVVYRDRVEVS